MLLGAIEAGGTKFVCAVGNEKYKVIESVSFPTTTPEETLKQVDAFFEKYQLDALGIGSFGPIDINKQSETYGHILSTPKLAWKNYDFLGRMKEKYTVPIGWTTDVNVAAIGEFKIDVSSGINNMLYITVGTGVGVGAIVNGNLLEGKGHPEMGHILVKPHPEDDYEGFCPYHGNCLEGLGAGPSISGRLGKIGQELNSNHQVWDFIAYYLGQALVNYTLIVRPERIIIGGGIMGVPGLLDKVRNQFIELLGGYVDVPESKEYIQKPSLGDNAGIIGALILASEVL